MGAVTLVGRPSAFCCVSCLETLVIFGELSLPKRESGIQPCAQPYRAEKQLKRKAASKGEALSFLSCPVWQISRERDGAVVQGIAHGVLFSSALLLRFFKILREIF